MAPPPTMNPAQAKAVEHVSGPLLVLAGAGSGKTRVITHRILRLMERGIAPSSICALTFTNKAAGEMLERVQALMRERRMAQGGRGKGKRDELTISTFHSFGLAVLGAESRARDETFTIFDQGDCIAVVKDALARIHAGKQLDAMAVMGRISNAKNAFVAPEDFVVREGDEYDEITKLVYPRYQAALRNFHAYDFDDLVCEVARLLSTRADVRARWRSRYQYLLVDEYQDTNRAQLEVLRLLAEEHKNICVVGDDDQSIYAWRGADVRNILDFEEHFAGATVVKLEQNYRSTAPILSVANAVIAKRTDAGKHKKTLFTEKPGGELVRLGTAPTPEDEAAYVASALKAAIHEEGRRPQDLAVLYRSNGQARLIEEKLREHGVSYRVVGGQQFFERKDVKDLLAYVKLSLNRADEISLRRVINYPARGIGDTSIERLGLHAVARGWSLWQAVERVDTLDDIPQVAVEGCKDLERTLSATRKKLLVERAPASLVLRDLADRLELRKGIESSSPTQNAAQKRWASVEGLIGMFGRREERERAQGRDAADDRSLRNFLHMLTLSQEESDEEGEEPGNVVTLSTLHGSKGLEFDVVCLIGCEEGFLPHSRTLDAKVTDVTSQDIEEERRLFYVGVTRARQRLIVSYAKARLSRGKPVPRTPSRFLQDIPDDLLERFEIRPDNALAPDETADQASQFLALLDTLGGE